MSNEREIHDHFFREARRLGYVARSAFKLKEILQKRLLIKPGQYVLDLGCAPGAWLQVACQALGPITAGGLVLGIDLKAIDIPARFCDKRVHTKQADIFEISPAELMIADDKKIKLFDVVLSDMMESTCGHQATDHLRSIALAQQVLTLLPEIIKPGGNLAIKVFEGELYPEFVNDCKQVFGWVKGFKPKASRNQSTEMYILAEGFAGTNYKRG